MRKKLLFFYVLLMFCMGAAAQKSTLLPVEEAFTLQARALDGNTVQLTWEVAEGYFLFRNKFRFQSRTPGIKLGEIKYPVGDVLEDNFFGKLEVYHKTLRLSIPLTREQGSSEILELKAILQGCLSLSQCYPSHIRKIKLQLPAEAEFIEAAAETQESASQAETLEDSAPAAVEKTVPPSQTPALSGAMEDDFLDPEVAFQFSSELVKPDLIALRWNIADDYYLYREQLKFTPQEHAEVLGKPQIPKGKKKHDEFFGEVEVYYNKLEVLLPLKNIGEPKTLVLNVGYQGCAEAGLCYPPIEKPQTFHIRTPLSNIFNLRPKTPPAADEEPVPSAAPLNLSSAAKSSGLSGFGGINEDELLEPDQAFHFSASVEDKGAFISAVWQIADEYYLYRDKFKFTVQGAAADTPELPPGKMKSDPNFGDVEVYYNQVQIRIPLSQVSGDSVILTAKYQGCAEIGLCYPPMEKTLKLPLDGSVIDSAVESAASNATDEGAAQSPVSEQDRIKDSLVKGNLLWVILLFFGLGLLLTFTPCVFPMIPILSSIIVGQGKDISTGKAFVMSLVYVLAMALTYTVAGVLTALAGENLSAAFQNLWVLLTFALIFVVLSLSMFGFYELQMPSSIQSKLTQISHSQRGGTLIGVAVMGFLSALIVGPCVTAPLVGALLYISQTKDVLLGGTALFSLSMGMGLPLILIGVSAGKFLPKAGTWMESVKHVFGVLLLAVAVWMLDRNVLPQALITLMWAALLIIPAVYMGALDSLGEEASGWRRLWKGIGVMMLLYGAVLVIGAGSGGTLLHPLGGLNAPAPLAAPAMPGGSTLPAAGAQQKSASAHALPFKQIKGISGLNAALAEAKAQGKAVMLDFYADWCVSCKEMEAFTFNDSAVQEALSDVVLLQADVTPNDAEDKALYKHFGIFGPPSIMFYDRNGKELRSYRIVGYMPPERFAPHVKNALK